MKQEPDKALDALLTYEYLVKNLGDCIPCYKQPTGCCASDARNNGDGCADGCEMLKCFKAGYKYAGDEITSLRAEVERLKQREADLLSANNRYLERARTAEKALKRERAINSPHGLYDPGLATGKTVSVFDTIGLEDRTFDPESAAHTLEKKL